MPVRRCWLVAALLGSAVSAGPGCVRTTSLGRAATDAAPAPDGPDASGDGRVASDANAPQDRATAPDAVDARFDTLFDGLVDGPIIGNGRDAPTEGASDGADERDGADAS